MAASGAARPRAATAAPGARRSSGSAPARRTALSSPACDRPEASRRSLRLRGQKENVPAAAVPASPRRPPPAPRPPLSPRCPPPSPPASPRRPPPSPPPVAPRVRRSYSRLEASTPLGRALASPRPPGPPCPPLSPVPVPATVPATAVATDLPGIGLGPERRRKRKVAPIDQGELEAWAARMNAQFEEAERFDLVVE